MKLVKDIKERCDKCNTPIEWENYCDYCGMRLHPDATFHYYLTITCTDPEAEEKFNFHFCDYEHMTLWMQQRTPTLYMNAVSRTTPYNWQIESRTKFKKED